MCEIVFPCGGRKLIIYSDVAKRAIREFGAKYGSCSTVTPELHNPQTDATGKLSVALLLNGARGNITLLPGEYAWQSAR